VEFIDTRDAATWILRCVEARATGVFNMTGPAEPLEMGAFLDACRSELNPAARLTWLPEAFLLAHGAVPWTEVPMWVPVADGGGVLSVDMEKALQAGLAFRPMAETIRDTYEWDRAGDAIAGVETQASAARRKAGLDPAKEAGLLHAWHLENPGT
ncbi:MAG: epimerase, partial [Betaproteobacteria bacterium]